ncbi:MAG: hydrogenase formation protein HypD [Planctomycetota bacterium]|jgi:hydrogenase expression/formation protein HypD
MSRLEVIGRELDRQWRRLRKGGRRVQLMEICGTHTVAVSRGGLRSLFPEDLRLVSGPGCPVCVTDQSYVDRAVHLARNQPGVVIATYGDMIRVPGRYGSLETARSAGADVRVVYAAHEAVELAKRRPDRQVVFLAIGFETTTPATALAIRQVRREKVSNFLVLTAHKLVLPAMRALLTGGDVPIDGFLCPGHVSVIIGWKAYEPIAAEFAVPCVVAGFDEAQILAGVAEILRQLAEDAPAAVSVYPAVRPEGNPAARTIVDEVFEIADAPWRALGVIPDSGMDLRAEYADLDAARRFDLPEPASYELPGCRCGEVITGRCLPTECGLFGKACTPRTPVGPCMVSSEGSCAAYYKYHWRPRGG